MESKDNSVASTPERDRMRPGWRANIAPVITIAVILVGDSWAWWSCSTDNPYGPSSLFCYGGFLILGLKLAAGMLQITSVVVSVILGSLAGRLLGRMRQTVPPAAVIAAEIAVGLVVGAVALLLFPPWVG